MVRMVFVEYMHLNECKILWRVAEIKSIIFVIDLIQLNGLNLSSFMVTDVEILPNSSSSSLIEITLYILRKNIFNAVSQRRFFTIDAYSLVILKI